MFQVVETFEMEVQPHLLLLEKTMLVAEGVSRNLDPTVNMWVLAKPLIEDWMWRNRGPRARLRDAVQDIAGQIERLPATLDRLDEASRMFGEGGVRLHPETIEALREGDRGRWPTVLTAAAVAALVVLLAAVLG